MVMWHNKTKDYWEFIATQDKHSMTFQIFNLEDFDEFKLREMCEDLIKYIQDSLRKVKK